jgi:arabinose-5-phosphate isomerase
MKSVNIREEIKRVLEIEIEAIESVKQNLTRQFEQAVELIQHCKGQVVVTGIGKSGIIGSKIAATLRSTGTPATFVHAGEALHGDIGAVQSQDVVLAIGKSGETVELNTVLRILKKNGNRIISITAEPRSSMVDLSELVLELPIPREACPLNLAPTASTTAMLAVGDALAVTLMKLKNVSEQDFAKHHPGGQLGRRLLMTVADVMRSGVANPLIQADRSIKEMLVTMTRYGVGAVCIVDADNRLLGLVTDFDVRRALESQEPFLAMRITDIMNPKPCTIFDDERAVAALEMMRLRQKPTAVLPVLNRDHNRVVGIIHVHDLISAGL